MKRTAAALVFTFFMVVSIGGIFTGDLPNIEDRKADVGNSTIPGPARDARRSLDWTNWKRTGITVDGNSSDWKDNYTAHPVGRTGHDVDLYMANDDTYLYICVDAKSDKTNEESVNDQIRMWFDGDDDNRVVEPNGSATNESTTDNWITICGNKSARSDTSNVRNDAGWLNTGGGTYGDPGVYVSMWYDAYQPYLQNRFTNYLWAVGYNGTPKHMVYEMGIPLARWNWSGGDRIGGNLLVWEHGDPNAIAAWPNGFQPSNVASWKDFYLATPNDFPVFSEPVASPGTVLNDNRNASLLTVEAADPDGNISEVVIDLSPVGGASSTEMFDDGSYGDETSGDDIYSRRITVPSIVGAGSYNLSFTVEDDHLPNKGVIGGIVEITVIQHNRPPRISDASLNRLNLMEDQKEAYYNLTPVFSDPDGDPLTYFIKNGSSWSFDNRTDMADYKILPNGTLRVLPKENMYGIENIFVGVTDPAGLFVDTPHAIAIIIRRQNDRPRFLSVNGTFFREENVTLVAPEDRWTHFFFNATDIDGDILSYKVDLSEKVPTLRRNRDYVFHSDNGTLKVKGKNSHVGDYPLNFTVDDGQGGADNITVILSIRNINDPPVLERIRDQEVKQGEWLDITPVASDEDTVHGDSLTFRTNFTEDFPGVLPKKNFIFNDTTGRFRFRPDSSMVDVYHTRIVARDAGGKEHAREFEIEVVNVNDPPRAPSIEHTVDPRNRTVELRARESFDPDGDELTYQWDFGDDSPKIFGTDVLNINHTYGAPGNYTVRLWVSDGTGEGVNFTVLTVTIPDVGDGGGVWNGDGNGAPGYDLICGITDGSGRPVKTAKIELEGVTNTSFSSWKNTDDNGTGVFRLPPGEYTLTVTAPGFRQRTITVTLSDRDKEKEVVLGRVGGNGGDDVEGERPSWLWILLGMMLLIMVVGVVMIVVLKRGGTGDGGTEVEEVGSSDDSSARSSGEGETGPSPEAEGGVGTSEEVGGKPEAGTMLEHGGAPDKGDARESDGAPGKGTIRKYSEEPAKGSTPLLSEASKKSSSGSTSDQPMENFFAKGPGLTDEGVQDREYADEKRTPAVIAAIPFGTSRDTGNSLGPDQSKENSLFEVPGVTADAPSSASREPAISAQVVVVTEGEVEEGVGEEEVTREGSEEGKKTASDTEEDEGSKEGVENDIGARKEVNPRVAALFDEVAAMGVALPEATDTEGSAEKSVPVGAGEGEEDGEREAGAAAEERASEGVSGVEGQESGIGGVVGSRGASGHEGEEGVNEKGVNDTQTAESIPQEEEGVLVETLQAIVQRDGFAVPGHPPDGGNG